MASSLIFREQVQKLLSDTMCHTDDVRRSHKMDVANKNIMFNVFFPESVVLRQGLSAVNHPMIKSHPCLRWVFWWVQVWADECPCPVLGRAWGCCLHVFASLGNVKDGSGGRSRNGLGTGSEGSRSPPPGSPSRLAWWKPFSHCLAFHTVVVPTRAPRS